MSSETLPGRRKKVDKTVPFERIENPVARFGILSLATGFGLGYMPLASGTFGSILGIPLGLYIMRLSDPWALAISGMVFVVGALVADRAGRHWGHMDSGRIVIDEVLGQAIAMMGLRAFVNPQRGLPAVEWIVVSFVLFRIFDIFKPYPARTFDRLPTGWGVVLDDVAAGVYAALFLMALYRVAGDIFLI